MEMFVSEVEIRSTLTLCRANSSNTFKQIREATQGKKKSESENAILRYYGIGAQIIKDLKIKNMILITKSPKKVIGLDGYGIKITKQELI